MTLPEFTSLLSESQAKALLKTATTAHKAILARKDALTTSISSQDLKALLEQYETYVESLSRAGQLADAQFSTHTKNASYRKIVAIIDDHATKLSSELLFFSLTLKTWPKELLEAHAKNLPRFAPVLRSLKRYAPYTLSEAEERIITFKDQAGEDTLTKLYRIITSNFTYTITVDGKTHTLSRAELTPFATHPNRAVRKQTLNAVHDKHKEHHEVLAEIYFALAKDWDTETLTLRKHSSIIAPRHLGNDITPEVFAAINTASQKNIHLFREYLELKRKLLGYKEFTRYDFSAPVPGRPKSLSFKKAKAAVLESFETFAPWMHEHAQLLFNKNRVDVPPRKGKRGGACCWPVTPSILPLVLLNHSGVYEDSFTMAHEFGHAIHDICAQDNSVLCASPPLVLAETASNFSELLLLDHELKTRKEKAFLLCHFLDEALASVPAQLRYTRFEEQAHKKVSKVSDPQELSKLWSGLQQQDFPAVEYPNESYSWLAIPHIFESPFYCYAYSFGFLLACAFWQVAQEREFSEDYKKFLSAGGSRQAHELLSELGFDITNPSFWEKGFVLIKQRVDELRVIVN